MSTYSGRQGTSYMDSITSFSDPKSFLHSLHSVLTFTSQSERQPLPFAIIRLFVSEVYTARRAWAISITSCTLFLSVSKEHQLHIQEIAAILGALSLTELQGIFR